jgi:hypothetical protein
MVGDELEFKTVDQEMVIFDPLTAGGIFKSSPNGTLVFIEGSIFHLMIPFDDYRDLRCSLANKKRKKTWTNH